MQLYPAQEIGILGFIFFTGLVPAQYKANFFKKYNMPNHYCIEVQQLILNT